MNFRPVRNNRRLWDTWVFQRGDKYHLFYLSNPKGKCWDGIGHATSKNLIDWKSQAFIYLASKTGGWDRGGILTGSTFKAGDIYATTYGATENDIEKIGLIFSKDLVNWKKYDKNPVLVPQPPYYESSPEETILWEVAMRDAFVEYREDINQYEALFCASVNKGDHLTRGCIGVAVSNDLKTWELKKPIFHNGRYNAMEVPSRIKIGNYYYLVFSLNRYFEINFATPEYPLLKYGSTYYAISPEIDGGYKCLKNNMLIGGDAIVGRIIKFNKKPLFTHHIITEIPCFALPKEVIQNRDGSLTLAYWNGLDKLHNNKYKTSFSGLLNFKGKKQFSKYWKISKNIIEAECFNGQTLTHFSGNIADFDMSVRIKFDSAIIAGVTFRMSETGKAVSVFIDKSKNEVCVCGSFITHIQGVALEKTHVFRNYVNKKKHIYDLRIFSRSEAFDVYIDGRCIFCCAFSDRPVKGKIGFFVQEGKASFSSLNIYYVKPEKTFKGNR